MLKVKDITFSYKKTSPVVLKSVGFEVNEGECLAILGNNGTGKSTLLQCISRILKFEGGSIKFNNENLLDMSRNKMARSVSYVAQKSRLNNMTVFDTVLLGRKPYIKWSESKEDLEIVKEAIKEMELDGFEMRKINELSGGEVQKVMIAKALAQETKILLLDEPTASLDPYNKQEVLKTVKELCKKRNLCILIVMHDLNLALKYCDKFLFLKNSELYAMGDEEIINEKTIKDVYGIDVEIIKHKGKKILITN